jgi:hypothetical protein
LLILCDEIVQFVNKKYVSATISSAVDAAGKSPKRKRDDEATAAAKAAGEIQNSGDYSSLLRILSLLLSELSTFSQLLNGIIDNMNLGKMGALHRDSRFGGQSYVYSNLIRCDKIMTEILEKISLVLLHKSYQNIIYSSVTVFLNILKSLFHRCEFYHHFLNKSFNDGGEGGINDYGFSSSLSLSLSSRDDELHIGMLLRSSFQDIYGVSIPRIILNIAKNPLNPSLSLSCHLLIACIESFAMRPHLVSEGMRFAQFGLIDSFHAVGGSAGRNSKKNTKHFVVKHLSPAGQIYFKDVLLNYSNEYKFIGKS